MNFRTQPAAPQAAARGQHGLIFLID